MRRKKITAENLNQFIIVNQYNQVFSGLRSGYPHFENDWMQAKPLTNIQQFDKVKRGTLDNLEILYL